MFPQLLTSTNCKGDEASPAGWPIENRKIFYEFWQFKKTGNKQDFNPQLGGSKTIETNISGQFD